MGTHTLTHTHTHTHKDRDQRLRDERKKKKKKKGENRHTRMKDSEAFEISDKRETKDSQTKRKSDGRER